MHGFDVRWARFRLYRAVLPLDHFQAARAPSAAITVVRWVYYLPSGVCGQRHVYVPPLLRALGKALSCTSRTIQAASVWRPPTSGGIRLYSATCRPRRSLQSGLPSSSGRWPADSRQWSDFTWRKFRGTRAGPEPLGDASSVNRTSDLREDL